jgi:hypothetical protein
MDNICMKSFLGVDDEVEDLAKSGLKNAMGDAGLS